MKQNYIPNAVNTWIDGDARNFIPRQESLNKEIWTQLLTANSDEECTSHLIRKKKWIYTNLVIGKEKKLSFFRQDTFRTNWNPAWLNTRE